VSRHIAGFKTRNSGAHNVDRRTAAFDLNNATAICHGGVAGR
jgi:hypothetical protein